MNPKVERLSSDPCPMILIIPVIMLGTKLGTKLGTEPWPWQVIFGTILAFLIA